MPTNPVRVIDIIKPQNDGNFPVVEDIDNKGGYQVRDSINDRNSIPVANRKAGMLVYVKEDGNTYRLKTDLTSWEAVISTGADPGAKYVVYGTALGSNLTNSKTLQPGMNVSIRETLDGVVLSSKATGNYNGFFGVPDISVKLLAHFKGVPGSTNFVDDSYSPMSFTSTSGVTISDEQNMFGGTSLKLTGVSTSKLSAVNNKIAIGSQPFTIEGWFYFKENNVGEQPLLCFTADPGSYSGGTAKGGPILFIDSNNRLAAYAAASSGGNNWDYQVTTTFTPTVNSWHHIALVGRGGKILELYADGNRIGSAQSSYDIHTAEKLYIGHYPYFGISADTPVTLDGYIDEIRITVGESHYSGATYTVPSEELSSTITGVVADNNWHSVFDIDCTSNSHAQTTITADSDNALLYGISWIAKNMSYADSISVINGTGLKLDPNNSSGLQNENVDNTMGLALPISRVFSDYDPSLHELRLWFTLVVEGADENHEFVRIGFAHHPFITTTGTDPSNTVSKVTYYDAIAKGHSGDAPGQSFCGYENFRDGTYPGGIEDTSNATNAFCLHLIDRDATDFYGSIVNDVTEEFPIEPETSQGYELKAQRRYSNIFYPPFTDSNDIELRINCISSGNDSSTFKVTFKRLKLEYRNKKGAASSISTSVPSGMTTFGGDLQGDQFTQEVMGIRGQPVYSQANQTYQVLLWDQTNERWSPGRLTQDMILPSFIIKKFRTSPVMSSYVEVGSQLVIPEFYAEYSSDPKSITLTTTEGGSLTTNTTPTNNYGGHTITNTIPAYTKNVAGNKVTYTLTASDGVGTSSQKLEFTWGYRLFYGVLTNTQYDSNGVSSLTSYQIKDDRKITTPASFNASTDQHKYYLVIPTSYGTPAFKIVNGLDGTYDWDSLGNVNIPTTSGANVEYVVWRSKQSGLGVVSWLVT